MHLKYKFEIMDLGDQFIAIPINNNSGEFQGVIKINETASFILELLADDTTEDRIADAIMLKYDAPRDLIVSDVRSCIEAFDARGILVH